MQNVNKYDVSTVRRAIVPTTQKQLPHNGTVTHSWHNSYSE